MEIIEVKDKPFNDNTLLVDSSCPPAAEGRKGRTVRPLKRNVSWV